MNTVEKPMNTSQTRSPIFILDNNYTSILFKAKDFSSFLVGVQKIP